MDQGVKPDFSGVLDANFDADTNETLVMRLSPPQSGAADARGVKSHVDNGVAISRSLIHFPFHPWARMRHRQKRERTTWLGKPRYEESGRGLPPALRSTT